VITERTHIGSEMLQQAKEIIGEKVVIHEEMLTGPPLKIMNVCAINCDLIIMVRAAWAA
jgi:hypothetical protein